MERWNDWVCWQYVRFEGEERAVPRGVRLACAAARVGDPVRITESNGDERVGVILQVGSTLLVGLTVAGRTSPE